MLFCFFGFCIHWLETFNMEVSYEGIHQFNFGVIKEWLTRSKTPSKSTETKQKISQSGEISIVINIDNRKD